MPAFLSLEFKYVEAQVKLSDVWVIFFEMKLHVPEVYLKILPWQRISYTLGIFIIIHGSCENHG